MTQFKRLTYVVYLKSRVFHLWAFADARVPISDMSNSHYAEFVLKKTSGRQGELKEGGGSFQGVKFASRRRVVHNDRLLALKVKVMVTKTMRGD